MEVKDPLDKLRVLNQRHLLLYWDKLSYTEQTELLRQIERLDASTFQKQRKLLSSTQPFIPPLFEPVSNLHHAESSTDTQIGHQMISEGAMGCILIAGGQASRLRLDKPKGCFPVSVIKHKSLFQLFSEKTLAASLQAGRPLFLAIMTSPLNHSQIVSYFHENAFFGLSPTQVSFFCQEMLPFLNDEGNLFLETPSKIAEGPNGNGLALHYLYQSGIWQKWKELGIQHVNFVLVDNPLADPFDAELLGFHHRFQNEISIKTTERINPEEKVGVVVQSGNHLSVIEYSEFPKEAWLATKPDRSLIYSCANLSLFCFSMAFIENICHNAQIDLPLHLARKSVKTMDREGHTFLPETPNGWKFEKFIFDLLTYSEKVKVILYPREKCYSPLKSLFGKNSLETVHQDLQSLDYRVFHRITGKLPPTRPFELSQEFHYPTDYLLRKWKGRELPSSSYIEA